MTINKGEDCIPVAVQTDLRISLWHHWSDWRKRKIHLHT